MKNDELNCAFTAAEKSDETSLTFDKDGAGNPRGMIMLPDHWSRWYVYHDKTKNCWGAYSEEHLIAEDVAREIERVWFGIRRGRPEDEKMFPFGKPQFVILVFQDTELHLKTFMKIVRVLSVTAPAIAERMKRQAQGV